MEEITQEEKNILKLFIQDININTVNMNREINQLSNIMQEMIKEIKRLNDSINMNRVRAGILKDIKEEITKIGTKKKQKVILDKINRYLFEDYNF